MNLLRKKISIKPNHIGFLYRKNKFERKLEPGIYKYFDVFNEIGFIELPLVTKFLVVTNQEVLTKDNIALRFSYFMEYAIGEADTFIEKFDVFENYILGVYQAEQLIHNLSQVFLRKVISEFDSETLNEKRNEIITDVPEELKKELSEYGLTITRLMLRDITFPKTIQDLFAKHLEAKIRAKSDLENARTAVATARALKNASELMKDDDNIKFVQFLETITKIAEKGKHTFVIGDLNQNGISGKK